MRVVDDIRKIHDDDDNQEAVDSSLAAVEKMRSCAARIRRGYRDDLTG